MTTPTPAPTDDELSRLYDEATVREARENPNAGYAPDLLRAARRALYNRGASDMKARVVAAIEAIPLDDLRDAGLRRVEIAVRRAERTRILARLRAIASTEGWPAATADALEMVADMIEGEQQ